MAQIVKIKKKKKEKKKEKEGKKVCLYCRRPRFDP